MTAKGQNHQNGAKGSDIKRMVVIVILASLLVITVAVTVWALFFRTAPAKAPVELAPDYAPQIEEENAKVIEGDVEGEKLEQEQGGGAVSLTYSKNASVSLSDSTVELMFANPSRSNQDMMLQLVIQDTVVVQSGLLKPGRQVTKLNLFDDVRLSPGEYEAKLVVLYYQQDTGDKATINTEIPLTVTVKE